MYTLTYKLVLKDGQILQGENKTPCTYETAYGWVKALADSYPELKKALNPIVSLSIRINPVK